MSTLLGYAALACVGAAAIITTGFHRGTAGMQIRVGMIRVVVPSRRPPYGRPP
ncbi:hypothetical protein GA0070616_2431 [Micromonospora nigra]|uniref:Uncharacterized protein n=1 Tax=Micromonospora nigra TaxID=145857 RepID=A0A1C6RXM4_9ACTN|nr:hypothetical protein [Micromonospora nigra]SCL21958.1 hypothetical protein GA0070616_2431 [Micromonospora nigra]